MAYMSVPSTNAVPVMGANYFVPPLPGTIVNGNRMVPPTNPLISNYVVPTTNLINGPLLVPATNRAIGPASGLVLGGGFIQPPYNSPIIGSGISVAPTWNTMFDYSRNTAEFVNFLSARYEGLLRCKKCRTHVGLDTTAILSHDQSCNLNMCKIKSSEVIQQNASAIAESSTLSTIDKFKKFLSLHSTERRSVNISPPPIENMSSFLAQVDRTSFIISQFECLSCLKSGNIAQWEEHVLQFHKIDSMASIAESQFELTCVCLMCNSLLFGTQSVIQEHTHRVANSPRSVNMSNSIALYPNFKCNNGSLSRYNKFVLKLASLESTVSVSDNAKMALYCSACDFFGSKKVEKHLSSFEHNIRSVVSDELRQCEVCQIIISSDALLMAIHRLTPSHLLRKSQIIQKTTDQWMETSDHQELMKLIQQRLSEHHFDSVAQRLAYFCDVCSFSTLQKKDWRSHKFSDKHQKNVASNNAILLTEFICTSCKLTLFGALRTYLGHVATKSHRLNKRAIVSWYNMQLWPQQHQKSSSADSRLKKAVDTFKTVANPHLSDLLFAALLGDDDDDKKSNVETAAPVQQQTSSKMRGRKQRRDSETDSSSVIVTNEKQLNARTKMRSESESSVLCKQKSALVEPKRVVSQTAASVAGSTKTEDELKPAVELRLSKVVDKWEELPQTAHSCTNVAANPIFSSSVASTNSSRSVSLTKPSASSADPTVNRGSEKSEDDESDFFYDCNDTEGRLSSYSSRTSSDNEAEDKKVRDSELGERIFKDTEDEAGKINIKNGDGEGDNDDDENDLYNEILASNEKECNPMLSDDELDASVLKELKKDAIHALNNTEARESNDENGEAIDENRKIFKHLIVVRGIPKEALQNKKLMYSTFSRFGEIHRTYVKKSEPDSLYILVLENPEVMYQNLKDQLIFLKDKFGAAEISVENDTNSSNGPVIRIEFTKEAQMVFSDTNKLLHEVSHLIQVYELESKSKKSQARIHKLQKNITKLAISLYNNNNIPIKVHIFGSRVTGLATENSDVDIYLQLGNTFVGGVHMATNLQQQLVLAFSNRMKLLPKRYQNVVSIPFARVPIVKFTDVCSGLNCDLSFKSGLSTMNSILVRTYFELDSRVKYLVCAVKLWMKLNNFADRHLFTTYAQIWMVFYFLMQPEYVVIPTVLQLRLMLPLEQQWFNIEGWNSAFPSIDSILWKSACTLTKEELLTKFFEFYSDFNLKNYVLCTISAVKLQKQYFLERFDKLPPIFNQYKFKIRRDNDLFRRIRLDFEGLCVQDPFDHSHNLTKTINLKKFRSFTEVCRETAEVLKNDG